METNKEEISIRGILVPAEWDKKGNAIRVALMTANEQEYLVEEIMDPEKLLGLIRQEVEVRGVAREEAGRKIILVQSHKQIR